MVHDQPPDPPPRPPRRRRSRPAWIDQGAKIAGAPVGAAGKLGGDALRTAGKLGGDTLQFADEFRREPFWQAQAMLTAALILYLTLPNRLQVGPFWLMPVLELLLVAALYLDRPRESRSNQRRERKIVVALLAMVAIVNFVTLGLLVHVLLHSSTAQGYPILLSATVVWLTNIVVFALWFWQLDRGGPDSRARLEAEEVEFLFPQMTEPDMAGWRPNFLDYFYVSYTNATAFSPTDAMPLTERAKLLMTAESLTSLVTVLLVAARAVNILK